MKKLWFRNYRPQTVDDFVFKDKKTKDLILDFIKDKSIPHLLLKGPAGVGKTSLALLLKNLLEVGDMDFYSSNASSENSINDIRGTVKNFISTVPMGDFKLVFFDEADRLTQEACDALKNFIQEYSENARFIFSTNHVHKIPSELRSRFVEIDFSQLNKDDLLERAAFVLQKEKIKVDSLDILEEYVDACKGDCRVLLNLLEVNSKSGKLNSLKNDDSNQDVKITAMVHVGNNDWDSARILLCANLIESEYIDMYRYFYENLKELDKFSNMEKWRKGIKVIAEYMYRHGFVADKEINFAACMVELAGI